MSLDPGQIEQQIAFQGCRRHRNRESARQLQPPGAVEIDHLHRQPGQASSIPQARMTDRPLPKAGESPTCTRAP